MKSPRNVTEIDEDIDEDIKLDTVVPSDDATKAPQIIASWDSELGGEFDSECDSRADEGDWFDDGKWWWRDIKKYTNGRAPPKNKSPTRLV